MRLQDGFDDQSQTDSPLHAGVVHPLIPRFLIRCTAQRAQHHVESASLQIITTSVRRVHLVGSWPVSIEITGDGNSVYIYIYIYEGP